jgi:hypothetical protein
VSYSNVTMTPHAVTPVRQIPGAGVTIMPCLFASKLVFACAMCLVLIIDCQFCFMPIEGQGLVCIECGGLGGLGGLRDDSSQYEWPWCTRLCLYYSQNICSPAEEAKWLH